MCLTCTSARDCVAFLHRNDLLCIEWDVKLLLTHSLTHTVFGHRQCLKWDGVLVAPLPWPLGGIDKVTILK